MEQSASTKRDHTAIHIAIAAIVIIVIIAIGVIFLKFGISPANRAIAISTTANKIGVNNTTGITGFIYCIGTRAATPVNQVNFAPIYANGSLGGWNATSPYPYFMYGLGCVVNNDYIYCMPAGPAPQNATANTTTATYYAKMTPQGIPEWIKTTPYPIPLSQTICTNPYDNITYCVGTASGNQTEGRRVFYAKLTSNGIGNFTETTPYPVPFAAARCSTYEGYVYCIGNLYPQFANRTYRSKILSSEGLGRWNITQAAPYPGRLFASGCLPYGSYLYCVGGINGNETLSFYTSINQSGIGKWIETTPFPVPHLGVPCTISREGYIYCIGNGYRVSAPKTVPSTSSALPPVGFIYGNESYYAELTDNGIGEWHSTTKYPVGLAFAACIVNNTENG